MSVLYVSREALREALLRLWRQVGARSGAQFSLTALGRELVVEYGGVSETIQAISTEAAEAYWNMTLPFFDPSKLATRLPEQDPLRIERTDRRLGFGEMTVLAMDGDACDVLVNLDWAQLYGRAGRAAKILATYRITERELLSLCEPGSRPMCRFEADEQEITRQAGEAWAELAPYGLDPYTVRRLVAERLRG